MKFIEIKKSAGVSSIKFMGITLYKEKFSPSKKSFLSGMISIKKSAKKLSAYFMGIKIYSKNIRDLYPYIKKIEEDNKQMYAKIMSYLEEARHFPEMISRLNQRNLATAFAHQKIFSSFENCFAGKDVVLCATGPSLKNFIPIKNAVYVGVNNTFQKEDLIFDYLFIHDFRGAKSYIEEANNYRQGKCKKFYGICADFIDGALIPKTHAAKANAFYYRADYEETPFWQPRHVYDISAQPLGCMTSIVFPALQFILWGNPRRIYLVGCDTSGKSHWDEKNNSPYDASCTINEWKQFKHLAEIYYPETEIISVNPVGLKDLFIDLYQGEK